MVMRPAGVEQEHQEVNELATELENLPHEGSGVAVSGWLGWGRSCGRAFVMSKTFLVMVGRWGLAGRLLTDHLGGMLRKIPRPAHLSLEASGGVHLVLAAATPLRGEPATGRWAVATLGILDVLRSSLTRVLGGPACLASGRPASG